MQILHTNIAYNYIIRTRYAFEPIELRTMHRNAVKAWERGCSCATDSMNPATAAAPPLSRDIPPPPFPLRLTPPVSIATPFPTKKLCCTFGALAPPGM